MAVTFQACPEPGARLFVPAPSISRSPTGDHRYAFDLWLRRQSGRDSMLHSITYTSSEPIRLDGGEGTPAFTALVLPAMRLALPLESEAPVSPRLLKGTAELQDVFWTNLILLGSRRCAAEEQIWVDALGLDPIIGRNQWVRG